MKIIHYYSYLGRPHDGTSNAILLLANEQKYEHNVTLITDNFFNFDHNDMEYLETSKNKSKLNNLISRADMVHLHAGFFNLNTLRLVIRLKIKNINYFFHLMGL